jgi:hypothetical protein
MRSVGGGEEGFLAALGMTTKGEDGGRTPSAPLGICDRISGRVFDERRSTRTHRGRDKLCPYKCQSTVSNALP